MGKEGILLWCGGLRIQCGHYSSLGHCCGIGSIPGLGTSTCCTHVERKEGRRDGGRERGPAVVQRIGSILGALECRFYPWPGNPMCLEAAKKKKKKRKKERKKEKKYL